MDFFFFLNLFVYPRKTLRALRSSFNMCPCIPDQIGIWHCWFFEEWGKPEYPEKNLSEQGENHQQTQPTYDAGTGNRTWATLVGGEGFYTAPALLLLRNPFFFTEGLYPQLCTNCSGVQCSLEKSILGF